MHVPYRSTCTYQEPSATSAIVLERNELRVEKILLVHLQVVSLPNTRRTITSTSFITNEAAKDNGRSHSSRKITFL